MAYESLITVKKMLYQAVIAGASGAVTYCINFLQPLTLDTNAVTFGVLLVIFKGAENYLKHRNDE